MELSESNATVTWSLREELLLAFAVKRHGLKNWETVAMELQSRSNGFLFTAGICKEKYLNLRKRFKHNHAAAAAGSAGDYDNNDVLESDGGGDGEGEEEEEEKEEEEFWWLEELRKLRVAELKMEVQRYDLSIESLKTKMKTMEEEGDKSLNREAKMADLDEEKEAERSENDKNKGEKATSAEVAGNSGSGEDGNGSFNESNSTENTRTGLTNEPKPVDIKPNESTLKPVQEDSCNDSSDSKEREREKDRVNSAELVNSSSESREGSHGTKGSSGDMQSSASQMTRRRNKRNTKAGNGGGGVVAATPATVGLKKGHGGGGRKPEPMFGVLDVIRSHKNGYVFQRRLEIQKSRKYNDIIRRHVDLEMVQARIEDGSYSSCPAKIYVDLLLLLNNAIVFFPKSSSQSRVAHQLRQVVMNHVKKHSPKPSPPPDPLIRPERSDPLLAKQKSSAPIVVCKKRSNIVSKPSSSVVKIEKQADKKPDSNSKPNPKPSINKATLSTSNEEDGGIKSKTNEKPVTGVRSVRKGINVRPRLSPPPPPRNLSEKPESSKASKEKAAAEVNVVDKKKGAANFLKRIKKNEPAAQASGKKDQLIKKSDIKNDVGRSGGGGARRVKEENSVKTSDHVVQTTTRRIGRPPKKGKEVLKGKRDRDGEEEGSLKRPMKRSRR